MFLLHDRPIHTRVDDSVLRGGRIVRRSRGYVPATLPVAVAPPLLAVGAELKSAFALARDGRAWVGHHIGDLRNYETLRSFTDGIAHFERLFAVTPELVAHDLHPEYLSTKYALELDLPAVRRPAPPRAPRRRASPSTASSARRARSTTAPATAPTAPSGAASCCAATCSASSASAHLWPVRMPGGEAAIREPWRMACAWLLEIGRDVPPEWEQVAQLARTGLASPLTSEHGPPVRRRRRPLRPPRDRHLRRPGRDRARSAAAAHDDARTAAYPHVAAGWTAARLVAAVVDDVARGVDVALVSARFHNAVARATAAALRDEPVVVLAGGVFQNALLLDRTLELLPRALTPRALPINDGAIAYGQAAIACARDVLSASPRA